MIMTTNIIAVAAAVVSVMQCVSLCYFGCCLDIINDHIMIRPH